LEVLAVKDEIQEVTLLVACIGVFIPWEASQGLAGDEDGDGLDN
jgi:hypothetical protein